VILGLPFFGIDWPTSDGTLTAQATGPASTPSLGDILASGHPLYWDPVTDSGWTSYRLGGQWHETFFEVPTSFYAAAKLAQDADLGGVGIWALGMDGNDPANLSALLGFAPAVKGGPVGPASPGTPATPAVAAAGAPTPTESPSAATGPVSPGATASTGPGPSSSPGPSSTTTSAPGASTTTTTPTSTTTTTPATSTTTTSTSTTTTTTTTPTLTYGGQWNGSPVVLTEVSGSGIPTASGTSAAGQLTGFTTNDPSATCLSTEPSLSVWTVQGSTTSFLVVTATPGDCVTTDFVFTTS
jgi:hypothetical protein